MPKGPGLSNIVWILAIVFLLTFLIVVVAWMSSGKLKVENPVEQNEKAITESKIEPNTFIPETPQKAPAPVPEKNEAPVKEQKAETPAPVQPVEEKIAAKAEDFSKEPAVQPKNEPEVKPAEPSKTYALQLGAFSSVENAKSFEKRLSGRGFKTMLKEKGKLTAVMIVGIKTNEEAIKLKEKLEKENIKASVVAFP
jgi:cell division septation protein DedD